MTNTLNRARLGWILAVAPMCMAALAGCQHTNQAELAAFLARGDAQAPCTEYRLMPPDVVVIDARPTEEYRNLSVQIGPDGQAFLPLIGPYSFRDKTTTQVADELQSVLSEYYQDVQVEVNVKQYNSQRYYVFGHVSHPGSYSCTGGDTLLSALAKAQPTSLANCDEIQLVRGSGAIEGGFLPELDAGGKPLGNGQRLTVNLWEMVREGNMAANVRIAHNDVIYVPPHALAAAGLAVNSVLFPVRPAIEAVGVPAATANPMP